MSFPSVNGFGLKDNPLIESPFVQNNEISGSPTPGGNFFLLLNGSFFLLLNGSQLLLL